jgi:hypothetical protein
MPGSLPVECDIKPVSNCSDKGKSICFLPRVLEDYFIYFLVFIWVPKQTAIFIHFKLRRCIQQQEQGCGKLTL